MVPAQLTSTSSVSNVATSACTAAASRTSSTRASMAANAVSCFAAATSASLTPVATTRQPSAAKARAIAAPMPLLPPVTRTVRECG